MFKIAQYVRIAEINKYCQTLVENQLKLNIRCYLQIKYWRTVSSMVDFLGYSNSGIADPFRRFAERIPCIT